MVILLGLAAAALYGSGDFLGGMATRRTHVLLVLMLADTAGVVVALAAAAISPSAVSLAGPCDRWRGSGIRGPPPALALPS